MALVEDAYRSLFSAMVMRSLLDLGKRSIDSYGARAFLRSDLCREICDVLDIPYSLVMKEARRRDRRKEEDV